MQHQFLCVMWSEQLRRDGIHDRIIQRERSSTSTDPLTSDESSIRCSQVARACSAERERSFDRLRGTAEEFSVPTKGKTNSKLLTDVLESSPGWTEMESAYSNAVLFIELPQQAAQALYVQATATPVFMRHHGNPKLPDSKSSHPVGYSRRALWCMQMRLMINNMAM